MSSEKNPNVHDHPLPQYDRDYCSCCRGQFIHGHDNVVQIKALREGVYNDRGEFQGMAGHEHMKAAYHAECFQSFHVPVVMRVECKYCGNFSMAKQLADGSPNHCQCSCHKGESFCSLVLL